MLYLHLCCNVILIGTFLTLDYKFTYAYAKKALTKENLKPYVGVDVRGFHTIYNPRDIPLPSHRISMKRVLL